jgi:hypothetical protein
MSRASRFHILAKHLGKQGICGKWVSHVLCHSTTHFMGDSAETDSLPDGRRALNSLVTDYIGNRYKYSYVVPLFQLIPIIHSIQETSEMPPTYPYETRQERPEDGSWNCV